MPVSSRPESMPTRDDDEDGDLGDVIVQRWVENVSHAGGLLPGAMLTDRQDFPNAIRWTIHTRPGSTSFSEIFARHARIAAGLRLPVTKVQLEPSDDDESWAILTVITKDLLAQGIPYHGPRYRDGRIPVGQFADGTGEAEYIACDEVGPRNGIATGEAGSGKSAFLEVVALALRSSGEWFVLFGDGDPEGGRARYSTR